MSVDITELTEFYQSRLGRQVTAEIVKTLRTLAAGVKPEDRVAGFGYGLPYRKAFNAISAPMMMPAFQGACCDPEGAVLLASELNLPFADESFDRIFCAHILEHTGDPNGFLTELSRLLRASGEIYLIVPNRRGVWAQAENTPFGAGRPYTKRQLSALCTKHNLLITEYEPALFFPPRTPVSRLYFYALYQKICKNFFSRFAGAHIVKAVKRVYVSPDLRAPLFSKSGILAEIGRRDGGKQPASTRS